MFVDKKSFNLYKMYLGDITYLYTASKVAAVKPYKDMYLSVRDRVTIFRNVKRVTQMSERSVLQRKY